MATRRGEPGIGIDASGNAVIDPTKNVEDLVKALRETLQEFRTSDQRYLDAQLGWSDKYQTLARDADRKLSEAETRRIDQLASMSDRFETTIRNMLAESVRTTSDLVSSQLVQIQATFNERVSKLEAGAFTQAGKSSVADPALSDALTRMAAAVAALQTTGTRTGAREDEKKDTNARMFAMIALAAAIASPVLTLLAMHGK